jgi:hypothetical protein
MGRCAQVRHYEPNINGGISRLLCAVAIIIITSLSKYPRMEGSFVCAQADIIHARVRVCALNDTFRRTMVHADAALLFTRVMGPTVLAATVHQMPTPDPKGPLKSYSHCARTSEARGGVALLLINLATAANVTVTLPVAGPHTLYRLQAAGRDESGHSVQLNGEVLKLSAENAPRSPVSVPRQNHGLLEKLARH